MIPMILYNCTLYNCTMYNVSETFWFRLSTVFRICMFCYWKLITFSLQSTANALALEIKDMMAIKERKTDSVEEIEERVVEPA